MKSRITRLGRAAFACLVCVSVLLVGCKSDSQPADQTAATTKAGADTAAIPTTLEATDETWTPEAMEDLLAPIALYPDKILGDVLVAATNPQEIVDAANWRVKNDSLEAKALDTAAKQAGFTPPTRVLLQNSVALDMMASELGWTEEVGQAFVNDQEGVLEAVQRLRIQAKDAGNLKTSDKMEVVEGTTDSGQEVIELESPSPEVVYVPEYDAEAAYVPASEQVVTTTTSGDSGHSTGTVIAAGVIGFGAGLLLGKVFNDDDDEWYDDDYYQPNYYGRPMPYYPAYPYRPVYGNGYNQSTAYVRPANYRYAYNNNTTVNRNVNNNYWGRYDNNSYNNRKGRQVQSPITKANPKRNDVARLNDDAKKGPKRKGPDKVERDREQSVGRNTGGKNRAEGAGADRAGGDAGGRDRADKGGGGDRGANKGGGGGGGDRGGGRAGGGGGGKAGGGGGGKAGGGGGKAKAGGGGGNKGGGGGRKRP